MCRREIEALRRENRALKAGLQERDAHVRDLQARAKQDSTNSSRPPSSDGPQVRRSAHREPSGRRRGGQPGHERHERALLPVQEVDDLKVLKPDRCGCCAARLQGEDPDPVRHQVTEIPRVKPQVTEYQRHRRVCGKCGRTTIAALPEGVPEGCFGPRLQAVGAYLSGKGHMSKRQVQDAMADLFGVAISLGALAKGEREVSAALKGAVAEARAYVRRQRVRHADETSWMEGKRKAWLWVAATALVTVFLIHRRRGAVAAKALLGQFWGFLVTDRWKGYLAWPIWMRQFCWAHLIRDFRSFLDRGPAAAKVGEALLAEAKRLFTWWHRVRDGTLKHRTFRQYARPLIAQVEHLLRKGVRCGDRKTAATCAELLRTFPAMWLFVYEEGVEPTNNAAERAIRPAVLYRKGCFGTDSRVGSRFVERILTAVTTLRQQDRNVLEFLTQACTAARLGTHAPSLLPSPSQQRALAA